ncbi:hypothetical protein GCM10010269_80370 [Streptomyces humidus]|uniref:Uncharacterized protein n=1 Tax=Streptomyces humidus TaxID=52259 RepID=A0A918GFA7_9ACTN|nr:hypothetical protein [Streptomyces humidus]GGS29606.1 hypothetical protein GCM10010269_80370 [Streptomyces humidus]
MTAPDDRTLAAAEDLEPTRTPGPSDVRGPGPDPGPVDADADAEYSATVLASHWIQRPYEPDATLVEQPSTQILEPPAGTTRMWTPERTVTPDRAEGTVLRFGPGVTAAVARRTDRTLPALAPPPAPSRRRPRRHALPALVLICVIAFLAWQRLGPSLAAGSVRVTARPTALGCGETADIVGLIATNGRPGTLSYRWTRSDGTASGVLREVVVRGRKQARVHLLWTFQGEGHYAARAELHVLSPVDRTVVTHLTYDCP